MLFGSLVANDGRECDKGFYKDITLQLFQSTNLQDLFKILFYNLKQNFRKSTRIYTLENYSPFLSHHCTTDLCICMPCSP